MQKYLEEIIKPKLADSKYKYIKDKKLEVLYVAEKFVLNNRANYDTFLKGFCKINSVEKEKITEVFTELKKDL